MQYVGLGKAGIAEKQKAERIKPMKVNPSLMSVRKLPGNVYEHLEFVRKQQEAAPIVFFCLAASALIVLAVMFQSCAMTGGVR